MISAIIGFVSGIVGWLASVLPDSPFSGLFTGNQAILTGLGWLNWLLPWVTCWRFSGCFWPFCLFGLPWTSRYRRPQEP